MAEKLNKDAVYKAAKPEEKDYFINDGGGLYLWVKSGGSKLWQFVYTFEGKRKRLALSAIFAYAIIHNLTEFDPAQPVAKQITAKTNQKKTTDSK